MNTGDQADGFVCQAEDLTVAASTMTGETQSVKKAPGDRLFMLVDNGIGRMLVGAVGRQTEWSKMLDQRAARADGAARKARRVVQNHQLGWLERGDWIAGRSASAGQRRAVTIVVVPISLAYSMKQMWDDQNWSDTCAPRRPWAVSRTSAR